MCFTDFLQKKPTTKLAKTAGKSFFEVFAVFVVSVYGSSGFCREGAGLFRLDRQRHG
jgi:hypothetical protein